MSPFSVDQISPPDPGVSKYYGVHSSRAHAAAKREPPTVPVKRFATAASISEADLADGFRFHVKQVNRPGQFSEIPLPKKTDKHSEVEHTWPSQVLASSSGPFCPSDIGLSTCQDAAVPDPYVVPQSPPGSQHIRQPKADNIDVNSSQNTETDSQIILESSLPVQCQVDRRHDTKHQENARLASEDIQKQQPADKTPPHSEQKVPPATASRRPDPKQPVPRRPVPSSVRCGDLEGPAFQSPSRPVHTPQNRISKCRGPALSRGSSKKGMSPPQRPNSQSSNVSRRRTAPQLKIPSAGSDRQRLAMGQMAQYWNKCIQISNDEKVQAQKEIHKLKNNVQQQDKQLQDCYILLEDRAEKLQELSSRCSQLEKQKSCDADAKQSELATLHSELKASKDQSKIMEEKYHNCRDKLNAAIAEQQDLYSRSRDCHEDLMTEAQRMADQRQADSKAVKKALKFNTKKRNELSSTINELRRDIQHVEDGKNAEIASLEEKIRMYERQLSEGQATSACLREQLDSQQALEGQARSLDNVLGNILQQLVHANKKQQAYGDLTHDMHHKLGSLVTSVEQFSAEDRDECVDARLDEISEKLFERLRPSIESTISAQEQMNDKMFSLGATMQGEIMDLQKQIHHGATQMAQVVRQQDLERKALLSVIIGIGQEQNAANGCMMKVASTLETILQNDITERVEDGVSQLLDTFSHLVKRNDELLHTSGRIERETAGQQTNFAKLKQYVADQSEAAAAHLEKSFAGLHAKVDESLQQSGREVDCALNQHKNLLNNAISSLEGAKQALADSQLHGHDQTGVLYQALISEQDKTSALKEKIQSLETARKDEVVKKAKLDNDITAAEVARLHLEGLQKKLGDIGSLPSRLERMCDLSSSIQATAKYLSNEGQWLEEQVQERSIALQEQRKVIVHSPGLDAKSPPPLTVEQEQRQRRELVRPRSILKGSQSSTDGPSSGDSQMRVKTSADVIEEIRSGLVQGTPLKRISPFPTIEDFVNSSLSTSVGEACSTNNVPLQGGRGPKRHKTQLVPQSIMVG